MLAFSPMPIIAREFRTRALGHRKRESDRPKPRGVRPSAAQQFDQFSEADRKLLAKEQRLQTVEAKADTKLATRQARKALEIAEDIALAAAVKKPEAKLTQAEIARRQALAAAAAAASEIAAWQQGVAPPRLERNRNREADTRIEGSGLEAVVAAVAALEDPCSDNRRVARSAQASIGLEERAAGWRKPKR